MRIFRHSFAVLARFFISLIFLSGAVNTILHWNETEGALLNILSDWQMNLGFSDLLQDIFSYIIPFTPLLLIVAVLLEFFGALAVLLGVKEKLGASLLILFLVPVTILMHQFWFVEGPLKEVQMIHFLKNLAILGALMLILLQDGHERHSMKF